MPSRSTLSRLLADDRFRRHTVTAVVRPDTARAAALPRPATVAASAAALVGAAARLLLGG